MAKAVEKFSRETKEFQQRLANLNNKSKEIYEFIIQENPESLVMIENL